MNDTALNQALNRHLHLPPEYQGGMTNHLPMALHALSALGASADRLQRFATVYARRFEQTPTPAAAAPCAGDWRALRGQPDSYTALHGAFAALLETQGVDATLRQLLPDLWSGVAAAAFHGVIRTAHAVESSHRGELTQALAYWAWRWQPLREVPATGAPLPPAAWTAALQAGAGTWRSPRGLISERMDEVQSTAAYADLAERLQPLPGDLLQTLRVLAAFAAERYALSRSLTVLHMVTACRAVRVLAPWLDDTPEQRRQLARGYAAAYLSCGIGAITPPPPAAAMGWGEVVAAALDSDDDHAVKLVHACREFETLGWPGTWLPAAARVVQRP